MYYSYFVNLHPNHFDATQIRPNHILSDTLKAIQIGCMIDRFFNISLIILTNDEI